MSVENKVRRLVRTLIRKTKSDEMTWEEDRMSNGNGYFGDFQGYCLRTEWLQDDKPTLSAVGATIESAMNIVSYDVQALITEIQKQQKRLHLGKYTDQAIGAKRTQESLSKDIEAKKLRDMNKALDEMLGALKKKKPQ